MQEEIEKKENELKDALEKDRNWIRQEYQRLAGLQDSVNSYESGKRKDLEKDRKDINKEKEKLERERVEFEGDVQAKTAEFEMEKRLLDEARRELTEISEKQSAELKKQYELLNQKHQESLIMTKEMAKRKEKVEEGEKRLAKLESEL